MKCLWEKTANGYKTECHHTTKNKDSRNFIYCPYCGNEIMKSRYEYQHKYWLDRKEKERLSNDAL